MCLSNVDSNGEIMESTTAIPSGAGAPELSYHTPQRLSNGEGYVWAYVTSLDEDSKFYTDQFVNYTYPTPRIEEPYNATGGLIYDFKVINGGGASVTSDNCVIKIVGTNRDCGPGGAIEPRTDVVIHENNTT